MFDLGDGEAFRIALFHSTMLGLLAALPALSLSYLRESFVARRIRPDFALHNSETFELNRALRLYAKICRRLEQVADREKFADRIWRLCLNCGQDAAEESSIEREDLEVHARQLRAIIVDLRKRPLLRLNTWIGVRSSQFALGKAIAVHVVGLWLLLMLSFHGAGDTIWSQALADDTIEALPGHVLDLRVLYANAVAAGFAVVAAPMFYFLRWIGLRRQYNVEFCLFRDLAAADLDPAGEETEGNAGPHVSQTNPEEAREADRIASGDWSAVLGLSPSASVAEIKTAYKKLIKQNHPDRVHGMSAVFRELAEVNTQRINVAYQEALVSATAR